MVLGGGGDCACVCLRIENSHRMYQKRPDRTRKREIDRRAGGRARAVVLAWPRQPGPARPTVQGGLQMSDVGKGGAYAGLRGGMYGFASLTRLAYAACLRGACAERLIIG